MRSYQLNKGFTIKVHDHGYVRYVDHMGTDERILEAARISYKSPSKGIDQDKKLLAYLYKNRHTSPFEMAKVTLNIKLPIYVMRQYVRHRMQSLNEVSARYTELPNQFHIFDKWRLQDTKNKQGSLKTEEFKPQLVFTSADTGESFTVDATVALIEHCARSYDLYEKMLESGIAREQARVVLPINIYTEIYTCWDLKNLLHFITLRDDGHAQSEIQDYSKAIKSILEELFPWTMEAYEKYKYILVEN